MAAAADVDRGWFGHKVDPTQGLGSWRGAYVAARQVGSEALQVLASVGPEKILYPRVLINNSFTGLQSTTTLLPNGTPKIWLAGDSSPKYLPSPNFEAECTWISYLLRGEVFVQTETT